MDALGNHPRWRPPALFNCKFTDVHFADCAVRSLSYIIINVHSLG